MDSNKKVKISVVIRQVSDKQSKYAEANNPSAYTTLDDIRKLFSKLPADKDEVNESDILRLLDASRLSSEIMADAFIDVNREDLFNDKLKSINTIDEIINLINKL